MYVCISNKKKKILSLFHWKSSELFRIITIVVIDTAFKCCMLMSCLRYIQNQKGQYAFYPSLRNPME
jgi:hypothetical protein